MLSIELEPFRLNSNADTLQPGTFSNWKSLWVNVISDLIKLAWPLIDHPKRFSSLQFSESLLTLLKTIKLACNNNESECTEVAHKKWTHWSLTFYSDTINQRLIGPCQSYKLCTFLQKTSHIFKIRWRNNQKKGGKFKLTDSLRKCDLIKAKLTLSYRNVTFKFEFGHF